MMKKAVLEVARQLDPRGATAAEVLGQFYMRTPAFFYQLNLIEWTASSEGQDSEAESVLKQRCLGTLPRIHHDILNLPPSQTFRIYEDIDIKAREASHQDDYAICYLLSILGSDDPSLQESAHA